MTDQQKEAKVISEGEWLDPSEMAADAEEGLRVLIGVAMIAHARGCCVKCAKRQPDDVRWPGYSFEIESTIDGESEELRFNACHNCERDVDAMMKKFGLPEAS